VGSEEGGCDVVSGRGGDAGAVHTRASGGTDGCTVGFSRRKKLGGSHTAVEAAGPARGQGPVGREAGGWAWGEGSGPREEEGSGPVADHTGRAKKGRRPGRNRCSG
jgi:hypothetical protein